MIHRYECAEEKRTKDACIIRKPNNENMRSDSIVTLRQCSYLKFRRICSLQSLISSSKPVSGDLDSGRFSSTVVLEQLILIFYDFFVLRSINRNVSNLTSILPSLTMALFPTTSFLIRVFSLLRDKFSSFRGLITLR